ncbi:MAG TPA: ABC transporter permease [Eoetvoesiella sp.]|jgi:peptide/nickel transport system permease protein|uniref:ABC transporter permease n=1 Tax=Eoetvoesiella sp. TaxID=1966355 RepID=UPI002C15E117|nr:ABC transporter permease [Eoetvoesiella sp.]HWK61302.1 ABC transporter permease [Eoetvoesiella sp.]
MLRTPLTVLLQRLLAGIPILVLLSLVVFVVLRALPSDPLGMMLPPSATRAEAQALSAALGLDKPLYVQFYIWLEKALGGDLGHSFLYQQSVVLLIAKALPVTLELVLVALCIALVISFPLALFAYSLYGKRWGVVPDTIVVVMQSIPAFLWGLLFIALFGVFFPVLPFSGQIGPDYHLPTITGFMLLDTLLLHNGPAFRDALAHMVLPACALALGFCPLVVRVLRSCLIEASREPYVMVARLRGVPARRILLRYIQKNALLPTITMIGVQFGFLFGSALLIEIIFSFPGIGSLMVSAVKSNDLPLIQGVTIVFGVLMVLINAVVDTLYVVLNPLLRDH